MSIYCISIFFRVHRKPTRLVESLAARSRRLSMRSENIGEKFVLTTFARSGVGLDVYESLYKSLKTLLYWLEIFALSYELLKHDSDWLPRAQTSVKATDNRIQKVPCFALVILFMSTTSYGEKGGLLKLWIRGDQVWRMGDCSQYDNDLIFKETRT